MSKSVASATREHNKTLKRSVKRGAEYEGNENNDEIELAAADAERRARGSGIICKFGDFKPYKTIASYITSTMATGIDSDNLIEIDEDVDVDIPAAVNSTTTTTVSAAPAVVDEFMHTPEFRRHFVGFVPVDALMALRLATKGWNAAADALIDEGVRSGELMVHDEKDISNDAAEARKERCTLVTRVIFFLNITKVGHYACKSAVNLVVVDIPEGVVRISQFAFSGCRSLLPYLSLRR